MLMIAGSAANYAKMMDKTQTMQRRIYDPKNFQVRTGNESVSEGDLRAMEQQGGSRVGEVATKMRLGQELSDEELEILRTENPELYQEAMKSVNERRAYEKRLSQCRTKDEVERVKMHRLQSFAGELQSIRQSGMSRGAKEKAADFLGMRMAGIRNEHGKFVKTEHYAKLPWEKDLEKKKKPEAEGTKDSGEKEELRLEEPRPDPELQKKLDELMREQNEGKVERPDEGPAVAEEGKDPAGKAEQAPSGQPAGKEPPAPTGLSPVRPTPSPAPAAPATRAAGSAPAASSGPASSHVSAPSSSPAAKPAQAVAPTPTPTPRLSVKA